MQPPQAQPWVCLWEPSSPLSLADPLGSLWGADALQVSQSCFLFAKRTQGRGKGQGSRSTFGVHLSILSPNNSKQQPPFIEHLLYASVLRHFSQ